MAIETLEDIVEEIMDSLGIYGAHGDSCDTRTCRCCASSQLNSRLRRAFYVDEKLTETR